MAETHVEESLPADAEATPPARQQALVFWILGALLLVLSLGGAGGYLGYQSGIEDRYEARSTQVADWVEEQYQLAQDDIQAMRLNVARQRLEAIIQKDPSYPGVVEQLTQIMLAQQATDTPTPEPSPTATVTTTPTPDFRGAEELFNQVKQLLAEEDWDGALSTLEALRQENINYRAIDVDGMYYIALRYRGMNNISQGYLEIGMYDLSLAERFGYLDGQAEGARTWTRLYLTGASFWEVDWGKASYYFGQVYPYAAVRDRTGQTAKDRYRIATIRYAEALVRGGDYCSAQKYYEAVVQLGLDPEVEPALEAARGGCSGESSEPQGEGPVSEVTTSPSTEPTLETPIPPEVSPTVDNPPQPAVETPIPPDPTQENVVGTLPPQDSTQTVEETPPPSG